MERIRCDGALQVAHDGDAVHRQRFNETTDGCFRFGKHAGTSLCPYILPAFSLTGACRIHHHRVPCSSDLSFESSCLIEVFAASARANGNGSDLRAIASRGGLEEMTDTYSERRLPVPPVRLRTLLLIRWIAAAGQLATVLVVHFGLGYELLPTYCLSAITVLVISNLVMTAMRSGGARLGDGQALTLLVFDALQLSSLLYLTGGLDNPFAILILAPVLVLQRSCRAARRSH